ncbi:DUF2225 domain-containing protein [Clostridium tetanomorphum]|uniref:DUF2225 domain-containing protein n=2 Tax=Clostridium tetanomorphum TaxID=1553 RepID=A0A923EA63_CLOTT|nr:DUF2225 domain-containing protein [Clostridium tetanomorphum]MBC2399452.1 DUF2225 domain-containing protein [Clostridium tetanomorphum]
MSPIYNREITCPVCSNQFKAKAIKSSHYRVGKKDTDFFIRYLSVNPYFYDVWLCNQCGYAALKSDFEKIRDFQIKLIEEKIKPRWHGRIYPESYDVNIAIERYKLALLNYTIMEAKSSKKAMTCLKLAWMYRLLEDINNELLFLKESLEGFNDAYYNESLPIYGMNKYTIMYLIGELNRRIGINDKALLWFGQVITLPGTPPKLKDLARDQKDLIKEEEKLKEEENSSATIDSSNSSEATKTSAKNTKRGFFSKLFGK